jgi:UDP-N-acetylglucosamine diphosphorylase/glucosamine-1-phosphate N-acetyltransferase
MTAEIVFFDGDFRETLKPLSFTRPISEFRLGITTLREKWLYYFNNPYSWETNQRLQNLFPESRNDQPKLYVYGGLIPSPELVLLVRQMTLGQSFWFDGKPVLFYGNPCDWDNLRENSMHSNGQPLPETEKVLVYPYHLLDFNKASIEADFKRLSNGMCTQTPSPTVQIIGGSSGHKLYIEPGAVMECVTVNLTYGSVYVGAHAEVMEGSHLRGPIAICQHATVNMGSKIYGGTTIGPWCKVGGEVNNSILFSYSNKGHDGFLGDSVLGEWCNLGADTNNSNLKNDYSLVKLWDYKTQRFRPTGRQFCGLIMGDHSKSSINTMFNTGTVVGVGANIATNGFPRNFIPSFSLVTSAGLSEIKVDAMYKVAERAMARRGVELREPLKELYKEVFSETACFREHF